MIGQDDPVGTGFAERLLKLKRETDAEILRRATSGKGPAGLVSKVMRTHDAVHAIWQDRLSPGGYGHLVVSHRRDRRAGRPAREAVFQVDDRMRAEELARDFGGGAFPRGSQWALVLYVRDPDGGVDPDGYPKTMIVADTSPEAGRAFRALGFDVH